MAVTITAACPGIDCGGCSPLLAGSGGLELGSQPSLEPGVERSVRPCMANNSAGTKLGTASRKFIQSVTLVKAPGAKEWMPLNNPKVETVLTIRSPDGSEHDQVFVY